METDVQTENHDWAEKVKRDKWHVRLQAKKRQGGGVPQKLRISGGKNP
jgi:hypothetical protein